mmetsp:Transcript_45316/g.124777  ORF Transcript_45316/g.124777 Transcript_45316/m.124777 type:complete len:241 (+) Transcript_45316:1804-2526(+)
MAPCPNLNCKRSIASVPAASPGINVVDLALALLLKSGLHRSVVEFVEVEVIVDGDHLLAPVFERDENTHVCGVERLSVAARDVERVAHHEFEAVVVAHRGAKVAVVLLELVNCDHSVGVDHVELRQHHLEARAFGRAAVILPQIVNLDHTIAISVQGLEGLIDQGESVRLDGSAHRRDEFGEAAQTVTVGVDRADKQMDVALCHLEPHVRQAAGKLALVEGGVLVNVHLVEDLFKAVQGM